MRSATIRWMTLDPAHFHAALVQKEMYPNVDPTVHVYAPLGDDLIAHLQRIVGFNTRKVEPTSWNLEVHAEPFFLQRLLTEKPGNVVVLSGRNRIKIDYILACVQAGLNVLADKPWILTPSNLEKLQTVLDEARKRRLVVYDIMTERYEITSMLQRELVNDPDVFGTAVPGTAEEPGVYMESVHFLMKTVAGVPLRRPAWYFDINEQGEGLSDVGTHLVDLVPWILFPEQAIDYRRDIELLSASRKPTMLSRDDFRRVTGAEDFPDYLQPWIEDGRLAYYCNTYVTYRLRGIHVKLDVLWDFEAEAGAGDRHLAIFRGGNSDISIRQGAEEGYRPELYVTPTGSDAETIAAALARRIEALQGTFPGVGIDRQGDRFRIAIPEEYRIGHEAHFAQVTLQFLQYMADPDAFPEWERANMLAKYYVTTGGVALAHKG